MYAFYSHNLRIRFQLHVPHAQRGAGITSNLDVVEQKLAAELGAISIKDLLLKDFSED